MCGSACPNNEIYYNWQSGKAEKCIFCYPRIEAGKPTVCSETCVGRIRYLGVLLYDADRIDSAAAVPHKKDLYEARADGVPEAWVDAPGVALPTAWRSTGSAPAQWKAATTKPSCSRSALRHPYYPPQVRRERLRPEILLRIQRRPWLLRSCPKPWCSNGVLSSVGCSLRLPWAAS